jgi:hypothetical protein
LSRFNNIICFIIYNLIDKDNPVEKQGRKAKGLRPVVK